MSAPDRIWIDGAVNANVWAEQKTDCTLSGVAAYEYVRADLCAKSEAISPMQDYRVRELVEAAKAVDRYCHWFQEGDELSAALRALEQGVE